MPLENSLNICKKKKRMKKKQYIQEFSAISKVTTQLLQNRNKNNIVKKIFEVIMAEDCSKLMIDTKIQVHVIQRRSKINIKNITSNHILFKLQKKNKDKNNILKVPRLK